MYPAESFLAFGGVIKVSAINAVMNFHQKDS